MGEMSCIWVECDTHGNWKRCDFREDYTEIIKHNPQLPEYKQTQLFGECVCKFCLEGQKINAMHAPE